MLQFFLNGLTFFRVIEIVSGIAKILAVGGGGVEVLRVVEIESIYGVDIFLGGADIFLRGV